ncbi:MAG: hypothetical protein AAGC93_10680 [Cyanobacteria bacterium P01_F01_bin.53]
MNSKEKLSIIPFNKRMMASEQMIASEQRFRVDLSEYSVSCAPLAACPYFLSLKPAESIKLPQQDDDQTLSL